MPVAVQQGEAQREGGAGHVAATHVQQPGDRIGGGEQRHVGALGLHVGGDAPALGLAGLAGKRIGLRQHRSQRRRRAIEPHGIDRIGLDRHEAAARMLAGTLEAGMAVDGDQPGIEAQRVALSEIGGDPGVGRFLGDLQRGEGLGIDLSPHRQRIAAVDEDGGTVGQDDGKAGRAAKAGEPGQALGSARHILALMLVGTRHHETAESPLLQLGAQRLQSRRRCGRGAEPIIGFGQPVTPVGEGPGQGRICPRNDQFDPFRTSKPFGGGGDAAHQGGEGRRIERATALPQHAEDVVGSGTHGSKPTRQQMGRQMSNNISFAPAKCVIHRAYAGSAWLGFRLVTYCCRGGLYICFCAAQQNILRCTKRRRT